MVRDYRGKAKPTSALLSGSTNFTDTDCHKNLNHIFVFHDAGICEQYGTSSPKSSGENSVAVASVASHPSSTSRACR